ncbi:MAG: hypothetical protein ACFE9S_07080 [Candidatus Hermodarchaeota archaeon]
MLYKSKINLTLILLIVGIGLIPTGFFIKEYLIDDVNAQVAPFLIALEEELNDDIEANYLGLGIYNVLPAIYDEHIEEIENNYARVFGIPSTLIYLKNATLELLPAYINASRAAYVVDWTLDQVQLYSVSLPDAREIFFNNYTFQDDYSLSPIEGVSEYMTGGSESLNYTYEAAQYLLLGRTYNSIDYPGLLNDLTYGTEMLDWLEFYNNAEADLGSNRTLIETVYNCSWSSGQLQNLSAYITTYLWDVIVKNSYTPLDLETYAENVFYSQWANGTWILSGFDLSYFSEYITSSVTGLEVGRTTPSFINYTSAINLWDPLNTSSFVNDEGILKWFAAYSGNLTVQNELIATFQLNSAAMSRLRSWLFGVVRPNLVPLIYPLPAPIGIGISISELSDRLYAEQWANGTYITDGFDYGLTVDVEPFEIGIPTKSNISLASAMALLDSSNTSSFIDRNGIIKWIDAYEGDTTAQTELIDEFNLEDLNQLNLINNWLFDSVRYNITPSITWRYTRTRMSYYAQYEFYRQWADGALYASGLDIGLFQGLASISGWEMGIPTDTNIDEYTAYLLWNQEEEYSFVNWKGISFWYKAMNDASVYNLLNATFNCDDECLIIGLNNYNLTLTPSQIDTILNWIVNIRDNFVLNNIQNLANLPTDSYTLGNNIFFMFTIAGGVISGIGVLGIVVLIITKRK